MIKNIPILRLLITLLLITSCASKLKVDIQIADRDSIILADKKYHKEYNLTTSIIAINKFIETFKEENPLESILALVEKKTQGKLSPATIKAYSDGLTKKLEEITDLKNSAIYSYEKNEIDNTMQSINKANLKIEEMKDAFKNIYGIDVLKYSEENRISEKLKNNLNTVKQAIEAGTKRTRFPILGDELASFIAKEENKKIWKSVFNKTVSSNFLGNADIAMILRSNPPERELRSGDYNNNFTIKGVRMDASDASNAIINGLTQTINFIANTQGIPLNLNTNTQSDPTYRTPIENPLVVNMQSDIIKLESKKRNLLEIKQLLIKKIALENIQTATDTEIQVKAKAKRIIDYWNGLKVELNKP